jgi:hypothetical protein
VTKIRFSYPSCMIIALYYVGKINKACENEAIYKKIFNP